MPKCLECGFTAKRLQWTHFRYQCTGKFQNGTEYREAYPGAKLVDDDLCQKTAVTESNLIKKYGELEGKAAWEEYRSKQAASNSFEYKQKKYGWTHDQFNEFNKSRAITLSNMIAKYGEEAGAGKWIQYCERQAYTNTKAYFIEQYGVTEGTSRYRAVCRAKKHTPEVVAERHDCTAAEAEQIIRNYNQPPSFSSQLELDIARRISNSLGKKLDYSALTKQYCVWANNKINFYDIVHNDRAIEIHGNYWHCNPVMYESNFYHSPSGLLAEDIWQKDEDKIQGLLDLRGIETLVIWESEYTDSPDETIKRCVKWIQNDKE